MVAIGLIGPIGPINEVKALLSVPPTVAGE